MSKDDNDLYIVKSDTEHGSLGIDSNSVVQSKQALSKIMAEKQLQWEGQWFAEKYIAGREFNITMLENHANNACEIFPIAEMIFQNFPESQAKIVDYQAKWDTHSWLYSATQRSFDRAVHDQVLFQQLRDLSTQCWQKFCLRGAARVDFRVDQHGQPWILEINPNLFLSKDSGFMAAALQAKMSHQDVIQRLIEKRVC